MITKADKGNCFVVIDRQEYDEKMKALLEDEKTYKKEKKQPFKKIERELNAKLLNLKNQGKLNERTYKKLHSTDGLPPAIRGSVKHHKPNNPLRPIVTSIGSALYHTSKLLADILSPLQNKNGLAVENSKEFVSEIKDIEIADDEVMVSFDVISLFTAIPVQKACTFIREKLEHDSTLSHRTHLNIDDIISLLSYVLSNNYFIFDGQTYKQIHGCAMGSPVSPVVANICMEKIEEMAIKTTPVPPKTWKRFVDDSFSIIKKNAVATFHNTLNSIDPSIQFTLEHENNGRLAFLDTIITRKDKKLTIDVHRKPTHTDRYLDYHSHHHHKHKTSTAKALIHRALTLPNTEEGRTNELEHVKIALRANNYPPHTVNHITEKTKTSHCIVPSPEELVGTFFKMVDPPTHLSFVTLPYIKGITEQLTRTLKQHDITVASKSLKTLQQHFPSPKHMVELEKQTNVIYKIPCGDCNWSYIGETGRAFDTRKKEHMRNVKTYANSSNIASHS